MQSRPRSRTAAGILAGISLSFMAGLCRAEVSAQVTLATRQVHEAQIEITQLKQQMTRIRTRVAEQVQARPQWAAAVKEFRTAQAALSQLKQRATADLKARPEYQALIAEREKDQDALTEANAPTSRLTAEQIQKLSDSVTQTGVKLHNMEVDALASQPGYEDARNRLEAAQHQMDQLDAVVTQEAQKDREYHTAASQLADAEQKLSDARDKLAQAFKADLRKRQEEARARAQQS